MSNYAIPFALEGRTLNVESCEIRHGNLWDALISVAITFDKPVVTDNIGNRITSCPVVTAYVGVTKLFGQPRHDPNYGVSPVMVSLPSLTEYRIVTTVCEHHTLLVILEKVG